jgi:hypothetical protein
MLKSNLAYIFGESVVIERDGRLFKLKNEAIIVSAGGVLPTDFLRHIGINVEAKFGTA